MNSFSELQNQHQLLLEKVDQKDTSIDDIVLYVDNVIQSSRYIWSSREREQLRAILRFWSNFIYDHTKKYPNTELIPFSGTDKPRATDSLVRSQKIAFLIIAITTVILFASLIWGQYSERALPTSTADLPTRRPTPTPIPVSPLVHVWNIQPHGVEMEGTGPANYLVRIDLSNRKTFTTSVSSRGVWMEYIPELASGEVIRLTSMSRDAKPIDPERYILIVPTPTPTDSITIQRAPTPTSDLGATATTIASAIDQGVIATLTALPTPMNK